MIVIADTSPLNYLIQIDCDGLLPQLYQRVYVPPAVIQELRHPGAPPSVRDWLLQLPAWIEVHTLNAPLDRALEFLDPGEREAIQLAQEQQADLLLIDERKGRLEAARRGLTTTGTIGVLLAAGELGLVDAKAAYQRLITQTTFRSTSEMNTKFLSGA
jgi:predicted nucleic acid-binding protein